MSSFRAESWYISLSIHASAEPSDTSRPLVQRGEILRGLTNSSFPQFPFLRWPVKAEFVRLVSLRPEGSLLGASGEVCSLIQRFFCGSVRPGLLWPSCHQSGDKVNIRGGCAERMWSILTWCSHWINQLRRPTLGPLWWEWIHFHII